MTDDSAIPPTAPDAPSAPLFVRPREGRMIAGVCAGIAQRWNLDLTLVRILTAVLALVSGVGIAAYVAAWLLTPSSDAPPPLRPDSQLAQALGRHSDRIGRRLPGLIVIVLAAIVLAALAHALWFGFWLGPPLGLLAFLVLVGLAIGTRRGRWLLLALLLLIVIPLGSVAAFGSHFGSRSYAVSSFDDLSDNYNYGAGTVHLDLTGLTSIAGERRTDVRLGSGDVTVTVPQDLPVVVHARAGLGSVTIDGHKVSGIDAEQTRAVGATTTSTSGDQLVVDVAVGVGSVDVRAG